jgi:predicted nucleotidyltransferase component of viral defense system
MIRKESFTKEWMDNFKVNHQHKRINVTVLEKMIQALYLLEQLKIAGLEFVFKGGTSLVLLLQEGNRFSIDIDIISTVERKPLESILDQVVANSHFTSNKLNEHRSYKEGIPKAHYTFYFDSVYNPNVPGTILLDILFDSAHYPEMIQTPIDTPWISSEDPQTVITPSINAITGDKLTAFAPNTVGIPYYKNDQTFAMEICKQLFDLSKLFEKVDDLNMAKVSFSAFAKAEIAYRNSSEEFKAKKVTRKSVLLDTINTCEILARREKNLTAESKKNFQDLKSGILSFGSAFLMSGNFRIEDALAASARVAYLAALILKNGTKIEYYDEQPIKDLIIENANWVFLNKLKRQPDKSIFYYWYKALETLNKL